MNAHSFYHLVEHALIKLGLDPQQLKSNIKGQWNIKYLDNIIMIDVIEKNNIFYFQLMTPILEITDNVDKAIFTELLEFNHSLIAVSFSKFKNWIYLKSILEIQFLSEEAIMNLINRIFIYTENLKSYFTNKYIIQQNSSDNQINNSPTDVLKKLLLFVEKNQFEKLNSLCDPVQKDFEDLLKIICKGENHQKISEIVKNLKIISDLSFFEQDNVQFARLKIEIFKNLKNLIFVKRENGWFFFNIEETDKKI